jgi:hypothetical protein
MFETQNPPLRPPLRAPEQVAQTESALPAGSERRKAAPASKPHRYARRAHPAKDVSPAFIAAKERTAQAAHDIRCQHGQGLTREECLRLVSAFRAGMVPRRRAGRRPKPQVTAAYLDWKAGMRGVALFRKHIPGWDGHHRYRKIGEQKALMDAIRSRARREHETA